MDLFHNGKTPVNYVLQDKKLVLTRYDSFRFASESGLKALNYIYSKQICCDFAQFCGRSSVISFLFLS